MGRRASRPSSGQPVRLKAEDERTETIDALR
jgi:hypothetical protein